MTLAPVFRSEEAVKALVERGYLDKMASSIEAQRRALDFLDSLLPEAIDRAYVGPSESRDANITFVQEHFFLVLFHSLFTAMGLSKERLEGYSHLNQCVKGIVVCGDNLFDREAKKALPLKLGQGSIFASLVQMLAFQNLIDLIMDRTCPFYSAADKIEFRRRLLTRLTQIGTLEGSEELGVTEVPEPGRMVDLVHRIRGGELFGLAFIAPEIGERGKNDAGWKTAAEGIRKIGTAFQIVDDLTDFEFDLGRKSHNILVSQIVHQGTAAEKKAYERILAEKAHQRDKELVEQHFLDAANGVYSLAVRETEEGFQRLRSLGFWMDPKDAELFVRAIAGDKGFKRIREASKIDAPTRR